MKDTLFRVAFDDDDRRRLYRALHARHLAGVREPKRVERAQRAQRACGSRRRVYAKGGHTQGRGL